MQFILENLVLFVACAVSFCVGGFFMPQALKDKITGVAPQLRAALRAQEAAAVKALKDAQVEAIGKVTKAVAPKMPTPPTPAPAHAVEASPLPPPSPPLG